MPCAEQAHRSCLADAQQEMRMDGLLTWQTGERGGHIEQQSAPRCARQPPVDLSASTATVPQGFLKCATAGAGAHLEYLHSSSNALRHFLEGVVEVLAAAAAGRAERIKGTWGTPWSSRCCLGRHGTDVRLATCTSGLALLLNGKRVHDSHANRRTS